MATQPTYPASVADAVESDAGILDRWRVRRTDRKHARLISARNRRILARSLRRAANRTAEPHPFARRREALLHYRAAAVRTDLLEIAAILEHTHSPDPARVGALHDVLANGCDSPLYNADIHISELLATLDYVRRGL
jgi:hypothetical protein